MSERRFNRRRAEVAWVAAPALTQEIDDANGDGRVGRAATARALFDAESSPGVSPSGLLA